MSCQPDSYLSRYGCAFVSIALAIGVRLLLDPVLGLHFPFATVFLAVIVTAWYGGFRPALTSVVLGAIASMFFLMPPGSFKLSRLEQHVGLVLFFITGFGIALLAGSMHNAERTLREVNNTLETHILERTSDLAQTNEKLRASEERFRVIVEGVSSHAIFRLDPNGNIVSWNPGAERINGYRAEEIIGQHFSRFYPPEDIASNKPQRELQIAVAEGRHEEEGLRIRKDGSRFWAIVTITPLYDLAPQPIGFVIVTRDISKRKELSDALQEAVRFNRATLDGLSAHIAILEEDGTIAAVNKPWDDFAAANSLVSEKGSTGANYLKVCDQSTGPFSEEGPEVAAGIREVLTGRSPQYIKEYPCNGPGQNRWFVVRVTPFPGEGRRRVIVAHENITERKKVEEALKAERDRFEKIVSAVPVVICSYRQRPDGSSYFPFANSAIEQIYGFRPEELARDAAPIFSRMHPEDVGRIRVTLDESARMLTPWRGEFRVHNPSRGELWVEGHVIPNVEPDGSILWQGYIADITNRKRAEIVLQDRERMLGIVTGSARVGLVVVGRDYRYLFANEAYAEIFGLHVRDFVGCLISEVLVEGWPQIQPRLDRALAGEQVTYELTLPPLPGQENERYYNVVYSPRTDESGLSTVVVVVVDITERKNSEQALRESNEFNRQVVSCAQEGISVLDTNLRYSLWNTYMESLSGKAAGEVLGKRPWEVFHFLPEAQSRPLLESALCGKTSVVPDLYTDPPFPGRAAWVTQLVAPLHDADGTIVGVISTLHDITERKKAEEARNLFRELLDHSDDAIEVVDPVTARFLDGNEMAWVSLGYSREEFLALRVPDIDPIVAKLTWNERMEDLRHSGLLIFETNHRRKDGSVFPVEVNAKYVKLDHAYYVAVVRDITERKQAERRRQAQHEVTRILATSPSLADASVKLLRVLCENLEWELGEFWKVDPEARVLRCVLTWHQPSLQIAEFESISKQFTFSPGESLPGQVWASRRPVWIPDVEPNDSLQRDPTALKAGLRAAVGFPITFGQEVLGVIDFFSQQVRQPNEDLIELMITIGSQIGQFIEQKRAEAELQVSEERFRQLAENIREVFWLSDPFSGKLLYVSPAYEAIWQRSCLSLYNAPGGGHFTVCAEPCGNSAVG